MYRFKQVFVVLSIALIAEAKADAKSNPNHHATAAAKSSLIGSAVQPNSQMHQKTSKNQASRRADIDTHGKNGFTSRSIRGNFGDQQTVSRTFRQTSNSQPSYISATPSPTSYSPAPSFQEIPAQSSYGVPQSSPVYNKPVEQEKKVIIKILPLPIPVGTPVPAPVHIGVPASPPFVSSQYSPYKSLDLLNGLSLAPRMDKGETEQIGTRRSADPNHSFSGGLSGHSDSHTHTSHHHTVSAHQQPQLLVAQNTPYTLTPQAAGYPTIP
jgi:hypothetical protein